MSKEKLRIVYMGTPDFAVLPLQGIIQAGFNENIYYTKQTQLSNGMIHLSVGFLQGYFNPFWSSEG